MGRVGEPGPRFGSAARALPRAGRAGGHAVHQADDVVGCAGGEDNRGRVRVSVPRPRDDGTDELRGVAA